MIHSGRKRLQFSLCNKRLFQKANLLKHHELYRFFTQQTHLNNHLVFHSVIRLYNCYHCKKKFAEKANLTNHEETYEGVRSYVCTICYKTFSQSNNLRRREALHLAEKPYICVHYRKYCVQEVNFVKYESRCTGLILNAEKVDKG